MYHSDVLGVKLFLSDLKDFEVRDRNDFDDLGTTSAGIGGGTGTNTPAAGGVAPRVVSGAACCISGLSLIFDHGPAPAPPCFLSIRFLAKIANNRIAAIPMMPSAMPIPAAAPLLRPVLPPLSCLSSSLFGLGAAVALAWATADDDEGEVVVLEADVLLVVESDVDEAEDLDTDEEAVVDTDPVAEAEVAVALPMPLVLVTSNRPPAKSIAAPLRRSGCSSQPFSPTDTTAEVSTMLSTDQDTTYNLPVSKHLADVVDKSSSLAQRFRMRSN